MIKIAQLARGPFCKEDLSATLEMTTARSAIKILRRFIIVCAAPPPVEPVEPIEPAEPLSQTIKGRHAP